MGIVFKSLFLKEQKERPRTEWLSSISDIRLPFQTSGWMTSSVSCAIITCHALHSNESLSHWIVCTSAEKLFFSPQSWNDFFSFYFILRHILNNSGNNWPVYHRFSWWIQFWFLSLNRGLLTTSSGLCFGMT